MTAVLYVIDVSIGKICNERNMKRLLMIVDPQIDFINGALPVKGAAEAMERLAAYLRQSDGSYVAKIVTADAHPYYHSSFAECGGLWPRHCVEATVGAALWPSLTEPLFTSRGPVTVLYKGRKADTDEYSIFQAEGQTGKIRHIMESYGVEYIDICGLAGDICVNATLIDGAAIFGAGLFRVLLPFTASTDNGSALCGTIKQLEICTG